MIAETKEIIPSHAKSRLALFDIENGRHYLMNDFCFDGAVLYVCEASNGICVEYWRNNIFYHRWSQKRDETYSDLMHRAFTSIDYKLSYEADMMHEYRDF